MDPLIYVSIAVVASVLLVLLYFLTRSNGNAAAEAIAPVEPVRARPAAAAREGPRRRIVRRPNRGTRLGAQDDSDEGEGLINDDEDLDIDDALQDNKVGAKKQRKLEEKEEKRRQREAELQEREEKKKRDAERDEKRKKDEAREAAILAEQEEEQRKKKEEQEKEEYEAYLKMKSKFVVEEEGTEAVLSEQQADSLLQDFINYIQDVKVVMLEDLAAHFRLKTQDCIDRVKTLMAEGRLSGVMDDRGKFIHITREEYESVAKFIKQRGRVSIGELVESSNRLIRLLPESEALRKAMFIEETVAS